MLNFWYSNKCTREIKLLVCMVTCAIIYYASSFSPLSTVIVGFSLVIGMMIHILRLLDLKLDENNKYTEGFKIIFFTIRIMAVLFLVQAIPETNRMVLIVQSLGFVCLGFFIVSIYDNRAKRFN